MAFIQAQIKKEKNENLVIKSRWGESLNGWGDNDIRWKDESSKTEKPQ